MILESIAVWALFLSILDLLLVCSVYKQLLGRIRHIEAMETILSENLADVHTIGVKYAGQNFHMLETKVDAHERYLSEIYKKEFKKDNHD